MSTIKGVWFVVKPNFRVLERKKHSFVLGDFSLLQLVKEIIQICFSYVDFLLLVEIKEIYLESKVRYFFIIIFMVVISVIFFF